jgi:hypothetical protein
LFAIDVETADRNRVSIRQIRLGAFGGGAELWRWQSLVNSEVDFDGFQRRHTLHRQLGRAVSTEVYHAAQRIWHQAPITFIAVASLEVRNDLIARRS